MPIKNSEPEKTVIEELNIENVESMTNNIGTINNYYQEPPKQVNKIIPIENGLSKKQKDFVSDTTDKIWELGKITKDRDAIHKTIKGRFNAQGNVTNIHHYPADKWEEGKRVLQIWLGKLLTHEKVIEKPPEWWRNHLYSAIHAELNNNGTEDAYKQWLKIAFLTEHTDDLSNEELAEAYKKRKNKFSNPKPKENPRDFELRIKAIEIYFDEMESIGKFSRHNIRMTGAELLKELQARDRSLFAMAESTFTSFLKQAKKVIPFALKQGRPPMKK